MKEIVTILSGVILRFTINMRWNTIHASQRCDKYEISNATTQATKGFKTTLE